MSHVDLFVIGAGSGGLAAAKRAASHGAKVAIAEDDRVGGTCVIRGCVPKKIMVYAAMLGGSRGLAADLGWPSSDAPIDWPKLTAARHALVSRLERSHRDHLANAGVQLVAHRARIEGVHTIQAGGATYHTDNILIASGATPRFPPVEGREHCLSSDGFFTLERQPASVLLVGGGYIAVELAGIFQALGTQVTMVCRSRVMRGFDVDLATAVEQGMQRHGIVLRQPHAVTRVRPNGGKIVATLDDGTSVETDSCVLFAAGRTPNTADLGLEGIGVQCGAAGEIVVDEHHQTNIPGIYAVGDVLNKSNLTPVAIKAGRTFADRVFAGKNVTMSYDDIPTAVFALPPVATVGMSEAAARKRFGDDVTIFRQEFTPLLYAASPEERKQRTFMKLVVHKQTDRVLGCHMVGDDAPEIIQGFAVCVKAGLKKADLDSTVAIHPTQAEELVLMR